MITVSHRTRARTRAGGSLATMALATMALVSACSSGGQTAASTTSTTQAQVQQICQQVSAVLADGPDPGTDPVGYAQAQTLPLEQLHVSAQTTIGKAISALASDYSSYVAANGTGKAVNSALTASIKRINALCPGAGATT
jgi:hypothetical protein